MRIELDRESSEPLYQQIAEQIRLQIEAGVLTSGERLPSSRELSTRLGVSRLTVKKAYELLIDEDVLKAEVGRGTFVASWAGGEEAGPSPPISRPVRPPEMRAYTPAGDLDLPEMDWEPYRTDNSTYQTLVNLASSDTFADKIDFTSAIVDPATVPTEQVLEVVRYQLSNFGEEVMGLPPLAGYPPLREWLEEELVSEGVDMSSNEVVIVPRFQKALHLISHLTRDNGEGIVCETPTYQQFVNFATLGEDSIATAEVDGDGVSIDRLEVILERMDPRFLYLQPNFQNPTGVCLSNSRRSRLLELLAEHQVPLLEDDTLRMVQLNGRHFYPLKADDRGGYVFLAGSFSKVLAPGLSVGYLVFPEELKETVLRYKRAYEPGPNLLVQASFWEFVRRGYLEKHLKRMNDEYRNRRGIFVDGIEEHFPDRIDVSYPEGGLTVWVDLPEAVKETDVLLSVREEGVTFPPSSFFTPGYRRANGFRLSFGKLPEEDMERGLEVIGDVLTRLSSRGDA